MTALFGKPLSVVNVGLASFADAVAEAGAPVARVEWAPPGGEPGAARALARLAADSAVDAANKKAFEAYASAEPVLEGIGIAREVLPGMGERMLLHSGPPITWARMGGAMRGAVIGACLLEGWAKDADAARTMAERGEIAFDPCHHHAAVGPMAGIISPSMPVWMLRNRTHGNLSFSNLNEGLGKVLRYGANSPDVLERLRWMGATLGPVLERGACGRRPDRAEAAHRARAAHGRRAAQPQRRRLEPVREADRPRHPQVGRVDGRCRRGDRVRERQRLLLPQPRDGGVQGHARRGARRARLVRWSPSWRATAPSSASA